MQMPVPPDTRLNLLSGFDGSLAQRTYLSLKQAILTLAFPPGEVLRKPEICARLGVSRSPVAEALARLAGEGLVEVVPQSATYVSRISLQEIRESAFLREALELAAIEIVAKSITAEQIALLKRNIRLQEVMVADGDLAGFHQADNQMHDLILSFTGHRRLAGLAETCWGQVERARHLLLPQPGRLQATLKEHWAIVAALEAREPYGARAATRSHLRQLVRSIEDFGRERPDLFIETAAEAASLARVRGATND